MRRRLRVTLITASTSAFVLWLAGPAAAITPHG